MANDVLTWAFKQDMKPATKKFLFVALADAAHPQDATFYLSMDYLLMKTCLDVKTATAYMGELQREGWIQDTGRRIGRTGQIKVWRMVGFQAESYHYVFKLTAPDGRFYLAARSCAVEPEQDGAYMGVGLWPHRWAREGVALVKEILATHPSCEAATEDLKQRIKAEARNPLIVNKIDKRLVRPPKTVGFKDHRFSHERIPNTEGLRGVSPPKAVDVTQPYNPNNNPRDGLGLFRGIGEVIRTGAIEGKLSPSARHQIEKLLRPHGLSKDALYADYAAKLASSAPPDNFNGAAIGFAKGWVAKRAGNAGESAR